LNRSLTFDVFGMLIGLDVAVPATVDPVLKVQA
jgi:hypothetical protein